jgi:Phage integrase family
VGVELISPLQTRKLFISRSDKIDKSGRNAQPRYAAGTRESSRSEVGTCTRTLRPTKDNRPSGLQTRRGPSSGAGSNLPQGRRLQWQNVDYANQCIHVRRTWIDGRISERLKTKQLRSAVPMVAELAQFLREWQKTTPHGNPTDWVFPSATTHGRTPRVGNMLVADHLCPAAIKAGVALKPGQRFGFQNLGHSLSSLLITGQKSDVRTTQDILRHSSSATNINLYTQSPKAQRIAAQESVLSAILNQPTKRASIVIKRASLRRSFCRS